MNQRIAIILCAGYGTRMYPLTKDTPKSLLQVGNKMVLDYLMAEIMTLEECSDIYLVSNDKFYSHFMDWKDRNDEIGKKIHVLNDGSKTNEDRLGAAGDLHFAFQNTDDFSDVIVVGGDNIFLFPLKPIWDEFITQNNHMIIALMDKDNDRLQKTGVLELNEKDQVIRLHEKPKNPPSHFFSPPLYFFKPSALKYLDQYCNSENVKDALGFYINFLCQKDLVFVKKVDRGRLDIGNTESYQKAHNMIMM